MKTIHVITKAQLVQKKVMQQLPIAVLGIAVVSVSMAHIAGIAESFTPQVEMQAATTAPATAATTNAPEAEHVPSFISIEKVQIHLPVVSVPLVNGTWQVNEGVANYAEGTNYVSDKKGNVGIFAHDKTNGFTRIKSLAVGDKVELETNDGYIALYTIVSKYDTIPSNVQVFYPTERPSLTLVTCNGVFSDKRHVVRAELVSLQKGKPYEYSY